VYRNLLPRRVRRAAEGRRFRPHYNGPAPRYEPAHADQCQAHHRKLPCQRCAGGAK
jgi:hypothetical protein